MLEINQEVKMSGTHLPSSDVKSHTCLNSDLNELEVR